jgi:RHS repeat-associated protein
LTIGRINHPGQPYYNQPDGLNQKFTGKERDAESGLDYFGARYYSSATGRFTSADDFLNDTNVNDPLSWNLYAYARNNPLVYVDPDGEAIYSTNLTDEQKKQLINDWKKKTGFKKIYFDKDNKLVIDTSAGSKGGSERARGESLAATTSTTKVFNLRAVSGAEAQEVAFADNTGVKVTENRATGEKQQIYETRIDFGDFKKLEGDKDAKKSFSIGLVLIHEFEHGLHEGTPLGTDHLEKPGFPGFIETLIVNRIRSELGLARRFEYRGVERTSGKYAGYAEMRFIKNGKFKILRWKKSVVGGK